MYVTTGLYTVADGDGLCVFLPLPTPHSISRFASDLASSLTRELQAIVYLFVCFCSPLAF